MATCKHCHRLERNRSLKAGVTVRCKKGHEVKVNSKPHMKPNPNPAGKEAHR